MRTWLRISFGMGLKKPLDNFYTTFYTGLGVLMMQSRQVVDFNGVPTGIRTPVAAVKGRFFRHLLLIFQLLMLP